MTVLVTTLVVLGVAFVVLTLGWAIWFVSDPTPPARHRK